MTGQQSAWLKHAVLQFALFLVSVGQLVHAENRAGSTCEANKCLVWAFLSPLASVSPLEELKKSVQFHETARRAEEQIPLGAREPHTPP